MKHYLITITVQELHDGEHPITIESFYAQRRTQSANFAIRLANELANEATRHIDIHNFHKNKEN